MLLLLVYQKALSSIKIVVCPLSLRYTLYRPYTAYTTIAAVPATEHHVPVSARKSTHLIPDTQGSHEWSGIRNITFDTVGSCDRRPVANISACRNMFPTYKTRIVGLSSDLLGNISLFPKFVTFSFTDHNRLRIERLSVNFVTYSETGLRQSVSRHLHKYNAYSTPKITHHLGEVYH